MVQRFLIISAILLLTAGFADAQTLKLATLAPEGSQWVNEMRAGAKEISARTEGRVKVKLYAGGVKGSDDKVLRKIRIRELHGAYFTATSLQDKYPDINIYGMPFVFQSEEEVRHVRPLIDPILYEGLKKVGFESFGFAGGGFAQIMSSTPIIELSDLSRQKVWVPEGDDISYRAMEAMGLSPVTLPVTDVLTGLQSGLIDIVGSPPVAALVLQWHTKVKYVTDLPLVYTIGYLALDNKAFARIAPADQLVVREVFENVNQKMDRANLVDNEKAMAALENFGLDVVQPDADSSEAWRSKVLSANKEMASDGLVSPVLYNQVLEMLADFRAGPQVASNTDD